MRGEPIHKDKSNQKGKYDMENLYMALAVSQQVFFQKGYICHGFGRTPEEAKETLMKKWGNILEEEMTLEELEKQIVVQQCVPGEGLSAGYSVNIPSTGRVLRYVTKDRMVTIPDKINESLPIC